MKNGIKIIVLSTISLIVASGVLFGILSVSNIFSTQEALDYFIKSFYIIIIISLGFLLVSYITSLFIKK